MKEAIFGRALVAGLVLPPYLRINNSLNYCD
jgi:hypothetical protein